MSITEAVEAEAAKIHPSLRSAYTIVLGSNAYTKYVLFRMEKKFAPVKSCDGVAIELREDLEPDDILAIGPAS